MEKEQKKIWKRVLATFGLIITLTITCIGGMGIEYFLSHEYALFQNGGDSLNENKEIKTFLAKRILAIYSEGGLKDATKFSNANAIYYRIKDNNSNYDMGGNMSYYLSDQAETYHFHNYEIPWIDNPNIEDYSLLLFLRDDTRIPEEDLAYVTMVFFLARHGLLFAVGTVLAAVASVLLALYLILDGQRREKQKESICCKIPIEFVLMLAGGIGYYLVDVIGIQILFGGLHPFYSWYAGWVVVCILAGLVIHLLRRLSVKGWYQHSLFYFVFKGIRRLAKQSAEFVRYRKNLTKAILLLSGLTIVEVTVLLLCVPSVFPGGYYKAYYPYIGNVTYQWTDGFMIDFRSLAIWIFWILYKAMETFVVLRYVLVHQKLQAAVKEVANGNLEYTLDSSALPAAYASFGDDINAVSGHIAIEVEKRLKSERLKTELITNVSHDIKTPLTSIINFSDLIEKASTNDPVVAEYASHLHAQSTKLKKLIEDLIEASKAATGNIEMHPEKCDVRILVEQCMGEYESRLQSKQLSLILHQQDTPLYIEADPGMLCRVFDNLMNNILKYAQDNTRVYLSTESVDETVVITLKNISRDPLGISAEELMERFVRGDMSRSTEGNGLGLSIVKSLMDLQGGQLELAVDGDLFKAILKFPERG